MLPPRCTCRLIHYLRVTCQIRLLGILLICLASQPAELISPEFPEASRKHRDSIRKKVVISIYAYTKLLFSYWQSAGSPCPLKLKEPLDKRDTIKPFQRLRNLCSTWKVNLTKTYPAYVKTQRRLSPRFNMELRLDHLFDPLGPDAAARDDAELADEGRVNLDDPAGFITALSPGQFDP